MPTFKPPQTTHTRCPREPSAPSVPKKKKMQSAALPENAPLEGGRKTRKVRAPKAKAAQASRKSKAAQALHMHGGASTCSSAVTLLVAAVTGIGGWLASDTFTRQLRAARTDASKTHAAYEWAYFTLNQGYDKTPLSLTSHLTPEGRASIRERYRKIQAEDVAPPPSLTEINRTAQNLSPTSKSLFALGSGFFSRIRDAGAALAGTTADSVKQQIQVSIDIDRFANNEVALSQRKVLARWATEFLIGKCDTTCDP